jgi:hypothetical protein
MKTTFRLLAISLAIFGFASLAYAATDQPACVAKQLSAKSSQLAQPVDIAGLLKPAISMSRVEPASPQVARAMFGHCTVDCSRCILGQVPDGCQVRGLGSCFPECP